MSGAVLSPVVPCRTKPLSSMYRSDPLPPPTRNVLRADSASVRYLYYTRLYSSRCSGNKPAASSATKTLLRHCFRRLNQPSLPGRYERRNFFKFLKESGFEKNGRAEYTNWRYTPWRLEMPTLILAERLSGREQLVRLISYAIDLLADYSFQKRAFSFIKPVGVSLNKTFLARRAF